MLAIMEDASRDARVRALLRDPYALAFGDHGSAARDAAGAKNTPDGWTAPFAMGVVNSRVVHRTNALLEQAYGRDFQYEERVALGTGPGGYARAFAMSAMMGAGQVALALKPVRSLARRTLPTPGEGPSKERREGGSFLIRIDGRDARGEVVAHCTVTGQGDPGYTGAAKMIVESARCLSRDVPTQPGGVLTPAFAMGHALAKRLAAVGITFEVS
jgi:short subunit dehydrogenase-like uncharacterized protein